MTWAIQPAVRPSAHNAPALWAGIPSAIVSATEAGSQVQSSVRFFDEFAYKASVLVDGEGTGDLKQRARSWVALGIHDDIESRNPVSCLFERE